MPFIGMEITRLAKKMPIGQPNATGCQVRFLSTSSAPRMTSTSSTRITRYGSSAKSSGIGSDHRRTGMNMMIATRITRPPVKEKIALRPR